MTKFTHLHVHSEYSLLDGLIKYKPLMERVKELGMDAVALTDHGGLYGAIKFYYKAKAEGIKPIIGVETYIAKRSRFDKDPKLDNDQYHLLLLAKNENGYKNLLKLVTQSYLEGYYYKPRVDFALLSELSKDVIALSGCLSGIGSYYYKNDEDELAKKGLDTLYEIFGGDFYIELQRHKHLSEQEKVNEKLVKYARKNGLPLVATADSHYLNRDDAEAQEVLLCIQTQRLLADPNRSLSMIKEPDFYIKTPEEMAELFIDLPEAIENTQRIADQVNIKLNIGKLINPKYPLPKGVSSPAYLRQFVMERLPERFPDPDQTILDRVNLELDIIDKKGYATYFLIVQDFTNWAKSQGIGVGPGRGSAAGSIISYITGITDLNPMQHNLPFERFLNPERESPPDIDMDFADDRREEVIGYVTQKYGVDHVAQIITFGTMEARAAVRDTGRVLGMSYGDCDRIAKMIPQGAQGFHMSIDKALDLSFELKQAYETEEETKRLLDLAKKLEGVARHASVHAAGVVIGDKPLVEYTPLQRESKGDKIITQYDMYALDLNASDEAVGLMKMDFLGLRNLTILQKAVQFIKLKRHEDINVLQIPLDDAKVFTTITSGNTTGIFQIESAGMRRLAKDLRPSKFSDIAAMIALFRPGPMDLIPSFVEGKINPGTIKYPHPDLEPILRETYGIIVYQEQCMEIAVKFAGYTMGTADLLRHAIGKKKKELMEKEKAKFIEGAQKLGHTQKEAEDIFAMIEKFASYGFNKAHAASYALITYQTAYMKAHYPTEFMAAVLSAETNAKMSGSQKEEKIGDIVAEAKRMGITILPPDSNLSSSDFTIEDVAEKGGTIRFGLSAIKNVGEAAIDVIIAERQENGEFKNLQDFLSRVDTEKVNKRVIESLIKAGAMQALGSRKALLYILDQLLAIIHKDKKLVEKNQALLFDVEELSSAKNYNLEIPKDLGEFTDLEILRFEKELIGFSTSQRSFLTEYVHLTPLISHKLGQIAETAKPDDTITTLGLITSVRKTITRSSQAEMAFIKLEDETGEHECIVFPRVYEKVRDLLLVNQPVFVVGKIDNREDSTTLIVNQLISPTLPIDQIKSLVTVSVGQGQFRSRFTNGSRTPVPTRAKVEPGFELFIKQGTPREALEQANTMLRQYPGEFPLTIVLEYKTSIKRLKYPGKVDLSDVVKNELEKLLGPGSLKISV